MRLSDILKKKQLQSSQLKISTSTTRDEKKSAPTPQQPPLSPQTNSKDIYGEAINEIRDIFSKIIRSQNFDMPRSLEGIIKITQKYPHELLIYTTRTTPDNYIYSHSVNVCILATLLANCLNYPPEDTIKLAAAAFLHDIGMTPYLTIAAKKGQLTEEEFDKIKQHPAMGQNFVDKLADLPPEIKSSVSETILQIHERVSGIGYPKGLSGENINEHAKIIAICDTFEAMTHPRNYREAEIPHNAIKNLINISSENFDTEIMKCFINTISLYPVGSFIRLSNNEIAKVIQINPSMPTRPTVKIVLDSHGKKVGENNIVNLEEVSILIIKEAVNETKLKIDPKIILEFQSQKWWLDKI